LLTLAYYITERPVTCCRLVASGFISQAAILVSVCPLCVMKLNTWNNT